MPRTKEARDAWHLAWLCRHQTRRGGMSGLVTGLDMTAITSMARELGYSARDGLLYELVAEVEAGLLVGYHGVDPADAIMEVEVDATD